MALFYPPPQPFLGGHQPLAPPDLPPSITAVPENPPPFTGPQGTAAYLALLQLWRPGPPQPYFGGPYVVQPATAAVVNDPPFRVSAQTAVYQALVRLWDPPPPGPYLGRWQAYAPGLLAPALTAVPVNNPPFGVFPEVSPRTYGVLLQSWTPGPPRPWFGFPLNIKAAGLSVDNPPFGIFPRVAPEANDAMVRAWQPGPPWIWYPPNKQIVSVDNPPTLSGLADVRDLNAVLDSWRPGPPLPATRQKTIVSVDNPPSYSVGPMLGWVTSWTPGPPQPWFGYDLNASFEAVRVDNPPVARQTLPAGVLQSWQIVPPSQQTGRYGVVSGVRVDNPPLYSTDALLAQLGVAWQPGPPAAQGWRYLVQGAPTVTGDNPPFGQAKLRADLWWQPPQWPTTLPNRQTVSVDQPPPYGAADMLAALERAWEPGAPSQQFYQRRIESVDNPPFPGPSRASILIAWELPPVPLPWQGYRYYVPGYIPDNPPFASGLRRQALLWPVWYAWLPPAPLPWVGPKVAATVRVLGYLVARVRFLAAVDAEMASAPAVEGEIGAKPAVGGEKETRK